MTVPRSPTDLDILDKLREGIFRDLNVCLPARVEKYDAQKQLVDVTPLIAGAWRESDDSVSHVPICVIPNCPVVFPGAGGFRVTFPIQVGDTVLLVFADRSLDAWQDQGGLQAVGDLRRHDITDAIAIPGLHPNNAPWAGASTSDMTLGKDGGAQVIVKDAELDLNATAIKLGASASHPVAQGDQLNTAITTLGTAIASALGTIATGAPAGGSAAAAAITTAVTAFTAAAAAALSAVTVTQ